MKLEDTHIATLQGGVFFDPIGDQNWSEFYERVRSRTRLLLRDARITPMFEPRLTDRRILIRYDVDGVSREAEVRDAALGFKSGRFGVSAGVPQDVGALLDLLLGVIGRSDWNELGCAFAFVFPMKPVDDGGRPAAEFFLDRIDLGSAAHLLPLDGLEVAHLKLKGTRDHERLELNLYNDCDQDLVVILDTLVPAAHFHSPNIPTYLDDLFRRFLTDFTPLFESIIRTPALTDRIDTQFLQQGDRSR